MNHKEQISAWVDAHREAFLEDVKTLCRIDSSKGAAEPGKPFGDGPYRALLAAEEMLKGYGLATKNYENYVLAADLGEGERELDILAHLDVVPGQGDWTVTEAFEPIEKDGVLYGRGVADDKGPAVAALYALRAVKELGIPLKKSVRLILGTDEESGSGCIAHYYATEKEAPCTFSPDAEYPVVNMEKGRLAGEFSLNFTAETSGARLISLTGGSIENAVPPRASAVLAGVPRMVLDVTADTVRKQTGLKIEISAISTREGTAAEEQGHVTLQKVEVSGRNAHAAAPESGKNALTGLLLFVSLLPLAKNKLTEAVQGLVALMPYGETNGTSLGVAFEDKESGPLTLTFSKLSIDETSLHGLFDCRYPVTMDGAGLVKTCEAAFGRYGLVFDGRRLRAPHAVSADSPFVRELNRVFEAYTGLPGGTVAMGGGTYVHDLKNGVAFGAFYPGSDTRMHAPDEQANVEELLTSAKIFAQVIADLCG